jgi:hypothetical protein
VIGERALTLALDTSGRECAAWLMTDPGSKAGRVPALM